MTHNFTTKRITRDFRPFHKLACIWIFICINAFGIWGMTASHNSFWSGVQAKEYLTFAERLPQRQIIINPLRATTFTRKLAKDVSGYWQAPDDPPYKIERLIAYQDMLRAKGITNPEHLKLFVSQLKSENGALSEDIDGDGGCSIGIPQRNVCNFGYTAKSFRKKYPGWKEWRTQMEWMAQYTVDNYNKFGQNARLTIINHNCPVCARRGTDTKAGYYKKIVARAGILSLL